MLTKTLVCQFLIFQVPNANVDMFKERDFQLLSSMILHYKILDAFHIMVYNNNDNVFFKCRLLNIEFFFEKLKKKFQTRINLFRWN